MKSLDVDAVKAFVLVAELQGFTRAADALGVSQSAVSMKLRKLEQQLGRRLLERTPRHVRLSAEGLIFLAAARELVSSHDRAAEAFAIGVRRLAVGVSHQLVGGELPGLLRRLHERHPGLRLEMRVAGTRELMQAFEHNELDAALVLRPDDGRKRGQAAFAEEFSWFAAARWQPRADQPLPLATQGNLCRVRAAAVAALDRAGIAWNEVFVGKGAAVLGAAAAGGLAVALLAKRTAPSGTVDVGAELGLPPIPAQDVMLYGALGDPGSREALRTLVLAFRQ
ncbi:LysR family transcriptional regulator [Lysobacter maris]|uniref:LysR family transcriptional regulator n=1 Tax=Marilutibacter maris TaxID=1605891 RepID=A0A508AV19_9GAMM|nr:LysR family transcriptional regulator [Lysobacter maris]KAB8190763.1 LysR family transcriptional regulator [Lysobacter maris]